MSIDVSIAVHMALLRFGGFSDCCTSGVRRRIFTVDPPVRFSQLAGGMFVLEMLALLVGRKRLPAWPFRSSVGRPRAEGHRAQSRLRDLVLTLISARVRVPA